MCHHLDKLNTDAFKKKYTYWKSTQTDTHYMHLKGGPGKGRGEEWKWEI